MNFNCEFSFSFTMTFQPHIHTAYMISISLTTQCTKAHLRTDDVERLKQKYVFAKHTTLSCLVCAHIVYDDDAFMRDVKLYLRIVVNSPGQIL